ncbi:MAG: MAPEG family protein [Tabrizicola sp.]|nr:MAPEG family protein [Tabrizicola sp.]
MTFATTAQYAVALTLIMIVMNTMVTFARLKTPISLGDNGNDALLVANRRLMNFVENVPMTLILMGLAEAGGAGSGILHGLGIALIVFRLIHPFGLSIDTPRRPARIIGSIGTKLVQIGLSGILVMQLLA